MKKLHFIGIGGFILIALFIVMIMPRFQRWSTMREAENLRSRDIPLTVILQDSTPDLPSITEVNLSVPFTTQAPHANWDMPYQEACEEASALMAIRYVFGNPILSLEDADAGILDLVKANEETLQYPVDQTVDQLRNLILEIDQKIPVEILRNPSVEDLKHELASGNVIIVPAAGRKLDNPFYQQPGPVYHMLVLRGYTEDGYFITNDPGTKKGEEYLYPFHIIMEAMGDWNNGKPESGEKVVLILTPLKVESE